MTGLLAPGRRAATVAAPRLTTSAWRTLRGLLTMAVLGAAAITGVQLGVTGPVTSPVQPPAAQVATADDGHDGTVDDDPQAAQGGPGGSDGSDRGPGARDGGRP